jgi:hypothetical protein
MQDKVKQKVSAHYYFFNSAPTFLRCATLSSSSPHWSPCRTRFPLSNQTVSESRAKHLSIIDAAPRSLTFGRSGSIIIIYFRTPSFSLTPLPVQSCSPTRKNGRLVESFAEIDTRTKSGNNSTFWAPKFKLNYFIVFLSTLGVGGLFPIFTLAPSILDRSRASTHYLFMRLCNRTFSSHETQSNKGADMGGAVVECTYGGSCYILLVACTCAYLII